MDNSAQNHNWIPQSPWRGIAAAGTFGKSGAPGIKIVLRDQVGMATVIAERGNDEALAEALQRVAGLDLPRQPECIQHGDCKIIWNGPAQWLLVTDTRAALDRVRSGLASTAAMAEQSDSRAVLSVSGWQVPALLAKGAMIDLHPRAFPEGAVALTSLAHIVIMLWRTHDGPDGAVFEIIVPRSMAGSFWSWLSASAAEFGMNVRLES